MTFGGASGVRQLARQSARACLIFNAKCTRRLGALAAASAAASSAAWRKVLIVESPAKAVKIQKFLGDEYQVLASYGHVRDLPAKPGAVKPEEDFALTWQVSGRGAEQRLAEIQAAVAKSKVVVLATDPDREGEAISWHIVQELQQRGALPAGRTLQRITFTEVTQRAVLASLAAPRDVSAPLVAAYLARRSLDRLVGFGLSSLLWRKLCGARSAGRVQSAALRLVADRDARVEAFSAQEYWDVEARLAPAGGPAGGGGAGGAFAAKLVALDGKRLGQLDLGDEGAAAGAAARVAGAALAVSCVAVRRSKRHPPPPFVTSTLQQEAARRLGFSASRTMSLAQSLYEGTNSGEGLITYMRTDGVTLSGEAVAAIRSASIDTFGPAAVPAAPRVYKSKAKNAQEAHEAIRPTNPHLHPSRLPPGVGRDEARLYELVWARSLACQMESAELETVSVDVSSASGDVTLRSSSSRVASPGFLAVYTDTADADAAPVADADADASVAALLALARGDALAATAVQPAQHFTKPPPRFNEASLVGALEAAGIGRPSTYAPTLSLLQGRGYLVREGRALRSSPLGRLLSAFLLRHFPDLVDPEFTSAMEGRLDAVSAGRLEWKQLLRDFWGPFKGTMEQVADLRVSKVYDMLDEALAPLLFPRGDEDRVCPACGGRLALKPSRSQGGFIGCSNYDSSGCGYGRAIDEAPPTGNGSEGGTGGGGAGTAGADVGANSRLLGVHPVTGQPVVAKKGPYGPYVQEGDESGAHPVLRRAALPAGSSLASISLEGALQLLLLPRGLGAHPGDGQPVSASQGRFGPYVQHHGLMAPLPKGCSPLEVGLEQAVALLEAKAERLRKRGKDPYAVKPGKRAKGEGAVSKGTKGAKGKGAGSKAAPEGTASRTAAAGGAGLGGGGTKRSAGSSKRPGSKGTSIGAPGRRREGGVAAAGGGEGGAARRSASGYILFGLLNRQAVLAAHPEAAPRQAMALVAAAWKALSDGERARYGDMARQEGAAGGLGQEGGQGGEAGSDAAPLAAGASRGGRGRRGAHAGSSSNRAVTPGSSGRAGGSSGKGGDGGSGRGLNGYQLFGKMERQQVLAAHPEAAPRQAMALVAAAWKALSDGERARYGDLAAGRQPLARPAGGGGKPGSDEGGEAGASAAGPSRTKHGSSIGP